jgi:hypothetical protein
MPFGRCRAPQAWPNGEWYARRRAPIIETLMPINQPSLVPAVGAGLLKTAGAVIAFGYIYPHAATIVAHLFTIVHHGQ